MQALRSAAVLLAVTTLVAGCSTLPSPTSPPATPNDQSQVVVNSLGMRLVAIPAGRFWMGSAEPARELAKAYPLLEAERFAALSDEAPVHEVHISRPFYLGQHEVTVGQFRRFLAESGYQPESVSDGTGGYGYNPRLSPLFNGDTPDNYRHFLKGLVDYHFDFGLNVGLRFQYRSGQPQWQSFRSPADSSFTLYRTPRGTDTGISNGVAATNNPQLWSDFRLPDQFPLDLQVGYNLQKLTGQNIDLMMMIFNLLNIATPTAIDTRDGATYGQATRRLENLLAEFVIRYRY